MPKQSSTFTTRCNASTTWGSYQKPSNRRKWNNVSSIMNWYESLKEKKIKLLKHKVKVNKK